MQSIVKGFSPCGGKHCVTTALKQVFDFYGYSFSEEMIFGIGAGLGFVYINLADAPIISGRIKRFEFEEKIANRLNIKIKCKKGKQYSQVFEKTKQMIDMNKPVLIYADMPFLKYLNLEEDSHFGGHAIVIFGYDEENEHFVISDRDNSDYPIRTPKGNIAEDFHLVEYSQMEKARNSKFKPFPANNMYLEFDFAGYKPVTPEIIVEAIHETSSSMLNPPAKLLGVKGIDKFSVEVLKWNRFETNKIRRAGIANYFMISADGGTGGGIFRKMYGNFLVEASRILNSEHVEKLGERYISVSEKWDQIADLLWTMSETENYEILKSISDITKEICINETGILKDLLAVR
ncbi:MAG: BtrH N-terminal domain-containing protein [Clostridia bacterium]|nr:BtrH N-terminal domain-containing protein [Clostridia bacterium]